MKLVRPDCMRCEEAGVEATFKKQREEMKSMNDTIYDTMLREESGFSSREILVRFFRMSNIDERRAERIVSPILMGDARFARDEKGMVWRAVRILDTDRVRIEAASFVLFCIEDTSARPKQGSDPFADIELYASFIIRKGGTESELKNVKQMLLDAHMHVFVPYDAKSLHCLKRLYRTLSPLDPELKTLSIKRLVSHLYPEKKITKWQDLVREFSLLNFESGSALSKTKTLVRVFEHIAGTAVREGAEVVDDLMEMSARPEKKVNYAQYAFDRGFLRSLPSAPGVYIFRNREGQAVYVGKTGNLRARVNSYFRDSEESIEKRALILHQLYSIEYSELGSDLEALIEEYRLIDAYRPALNTRVQIPQRIVETQDTILVLPLCFQKGLKLYFLSNTSPLVEYEFTGPRAGEEAGGASGEDAGRGIREIVRKLKKGRDHVFDPLKIIALDYWKRYEDRVNTIDIDSFRSVDDIISILHAFLGNVERITREKIRYV